MSNLKINDAVILLIRTVCDAIREAGSIPSGHLYAALMTQGCSLQQYETLIDALKGAGKIRVENHLITWIG